MREIAPGMYVEDDVLGIVQRIQEYDSNLRVKFLDPGRAEVMDAPYLITEVCPDGQERIVLRVWQLDERVLERLWLADTNKYDVLASIDKKNQEAKDKANRRYKEEIAEANDISLSFFRSPKGNYTFKNKSNEVIELSDDPSRKPSRRIR